MQPHLHSSHCTFNLVMITRWAAAIAFLVYFSFSILIPPERQLPLTSHRLIRPNESAVTQEEATQKELEAGPHLQAQKGRRLLESSNSNDAVMRFPLMHRNSPRSPFHKLYSNNLEALKDAREMDLLRYEGFQERLQSSLAALRVSEAGSSSDPSSADTDSHKGHRVKTRVRSGAAAGVGQYFVDFYIGTPAKKFLLIADTGSDLIWVRCSDCAQCSSNSSPIFSTQSSATYSPIPCISRECLLVPAPLHFSCNLQFPAACRYDYVYADLSESNGIFALETVTITSLSGRSLRISDVGFGCGLSNTGRSFAGSDGVMGLGRGTISFASQIGPLVGGQRFSYCLVDFFRTPTEDSYLVFGSLPPSPQGLGLRYTPLLKNPVGPSFYYVGIHEVRVDGELLPIPSSVWEIDANGNGGTVIDSGTTLTILVEPAYRMILHAMTRALVYPQTAPLQTFDLCFNASGIANPQLPKLTITFQGNASFAPPPANYFIEVVEGVRCLGLQGVQSASGQLSVLGNLIQQNFHMEYDIGNSQLGFAPTVCSYGT